MDIRSDRQKGLSYVELGRKYHMDPRTECPDSRRTKLCDETSDGTPQRPVPGIFRTGEENTPRSHPIRKDS